MQPRKVGRVVGWCLLAVGTVGVAAHYIGVTSNLVARAASFTPLLTICVGIAVLVLALCRAWVSAVIAVLVLTVGIAAQVPLYRGVAEQRSASDLTVMQANIYLGQADAASIVAQIRDARVDILTVAELTDGGLARLRAAGIDRELPYAFLMPREGGGGTGIYSRHPVVARETLHRFSLNNLRAVIDVPGIGQRAVYALHPIPPYPEPSWKWAGELAKLGDILTAERLPLIVGADFNSTYDHRQFRALLAGSRLDATSGSAQLVDAAEHLGAGIVPTYPADRRYPPFLALDRVLAGGCVPTSFRRIPLPGSDHDGVIATIRA